MSAPKYHIIFTRLNRFFYKYSLLTNAIVENNPFQNILPNVAWREEEKATRSSSRGTGWRNVLPAKESGGMIFPPLLLAERVCWQLCLAHRFI
jgi:hypothetical protein